MRGAKLQYFAHDKIVHNRTRVNAKVADTGGRRAERLLRDNLVDDLCAIVALLWFNRIAGKHRREQVAEDRWAIEMQAPYHIGWDCWGAGRIEQHQEIDLDIPFAKLSRHSDSVVRPIAVPNKDERSLRVSS